MQIGHKEGYLTKRGKNFGGWKTRFFVLQGPVLEYYDCVCHLQAIPEIQVRDLLFVAWRYPPWINYHYWCTNRTTAQDREASTQR